MAFIFEYPRSIIFNSPKDFFCLYDFLNSVQEVCCVYGFKGWGILPGKDKDTPYTGSKLLTHL